MNRTKPLTGVCSECGGSIEFAAELIGTMIQCPRCRKQTELRLAAPPEEPSVPRKAILWAVVASVILALGVIGLLAGLKRAEKLAAGKRSRTSATADAPAGLEVSAISLEKGAGAAEHVVVGTVANASGRLRSEVAVEIKLLDAGGREVGVVRGFKPVLAPGEKWRFNLPAGDVQAASAKLASVKERP